MGSFGAHAQSREQGTCRAEARAASPRWRPRLTRAASGDRKRPRVTPPTVAVGHLPAARSLSPIPATRSGGGTTLRMEPRRSRATDSGSMSETMPRASSTLACSHPIAAPVLARSRAAAVTMSFWLDYFESCAYSAEPEGSVRERGGEFENEGARSRERRVQDRRCGHAPRGAPRLLVGRTAMRCATRTCNVPLHGRPSCSVP